MSVNYTRDGSLGFTPDGWMILLSSTTCAWQVFDEEARHVGTYATRDQAEEATR